MFLSVLSHLNDQNVNHSMRRIIASVAPAFTWEKDLLFASVPDIHSRHRKRVLKEEIANNVMGVSFISNEKAGRLGKEMRYRIFSEYAHFYYDGLRV